MSKKFCFQTAESIMRQINVAVDADFQIFTFLNPIFFGNRTMGTSPRCPPIEKRGYKTLYSLRMGNLLRLSMESMALSSIKLG